jgi:hypothetical protein
LKIFSNAFLDNLQSEYDMVYLLVDRLENANEGQLVKILLKLVPEEVLNNGTDANE